MPLLAPALLAPSPSPHFDRDCPGDTRDMYGPGAAEGEHNFRRGKPRGFRNMKQLSVSSATAFRRFSSTSSAFPSRFSFFPPPALPHRKKTVYRPHRRGSGGARRLRRVGRRPGRCGDRRRAAGGLLPRAAGERECVVGAVVGRRCRLGPLTLAQGRMT